MSVYRRPGQTEYSYDFRLGGRRFSGGTGKTEKRAAEIVERAQRDEARRLIAEGAALNQPTTWAEASSRYWLEVGQYHRNAGTTLACLEWLTNALGARTRLTDITDNSVAILVARRRAEPNAVRRKNPPPLSPATINRTVTEPLRKVLRRAREVWGVPVGRINWSQHMLAEPRERIREASAAEEAAILSRLPPGYDEAVRFGFLSGLRRAELCGLLWTDVDFFGRQIRIEGKGGKISSVPMSEAMRAMLWQLRGAHPTHVFSFICRRTRDIPVVDGEPWRMVRGERYPIQLSGLTHALIKAARAAGITDFRLHDTRHTTATRALRVSNIKVVQRLLRHEDIATTAKYAHAMTEDVRAALDAMSAAATPTEIATATATTGDKQLKSEGK